MVDLVAHGDGTQFVISDVRFANEAQWVRRNNGKLWAIQRPNAGQQGQHTSDTTGLEFDPDLVINNCHDIKHLQVLVMSAFIELECNVKVSQLVLG
jgi:hypothetical protein